MSWQCMCASATTEKALCSPSLEFCSLLREYARWHCRRVAIARHVINLPRTREYISVNAKAAFSSFQTMWGRWRLVDVQVQYPAGRSTSLL